MRNQPLRLLESSSTNVLMCDQRCHVATCRISL